MLPFVYTLSLVLIAVNAAELFAKKIEHESFPPPVRKFLSRELTNPTAYALARLIYIVLWLALFAVSVILALTSEEFRDLLGLKTTASADNVAFPLFVAISLFAISKVAAATHVEEPIRRYLLSLASVPTAARTLVQRMRESDFSWTEVTRKQAELVLLYPPTGDAGSDDAWAAIRAKLALKEREESWFRVGLFLEEEVTRFSAAHRAGAWPDFYERHRDTIWSFRTEYLDLKKTLADRLPDDASAQDWLAAFQDFLASKGDRIAALEEKLLYVIAAATLQRPSEVNSGLVLRCFGFPQPSETRPSRYGQLVGAFLTAGLVSLFALFALSLGAHRETGSPGSERTYAAPQPSVAESNGGVGEQRSAQGPTEPGRPHDVGLNDISCLWTPACFLREKAGWPSRDAKTLWNNITFHFVSFIVVVCPIAVILWFFYSNDIGNTRTTALPWIIALFLVIALDLVSRVVTSCHLSYLVEGRCYLPPPEGPTWSNWPWSWRLSATWDAYWQAGDRTEPTSPSDPNAPFAAVLKLVVGRYFTNFSFLERIPLLLIGFTAGLLFEGSEERKDKFWSRFRKFTVLVLCIFCIAVLINFVRFGGPSTDLRTGAPLDPEFGSVVAFSIRDLIFLVTFAAFFAVAELARFLKARSKSPNAAEPGGEALLRLARWRWR